MNGAGGSRDPLVPLIVAHAAARCSRCYVYDFLHLVKRAKEDGLRLEIERIDRKREWVPFHTHTHIEERERERERERFVGSV